MRDVSVLENAQRCAWRVDGGRGEAGGVGEGGQGCSFWEEQQRKVRMRAHILWFSNDVIQ